MHPRVNVTWYEAVSFCRWLGTLSGFAGCAPRLPVEEEWEVACRAGTSSRFWRGGDDKDLAAVGWFDENGENRTHRAAGKPASSRGLYDVHGGAWEWTASPWQVDRYRDREEGVHRIDPTTLPADLAGPPRVGRVLRGGSCWDSAALCRSAFRAAWIPWSGVWVRGFRVLLSSVPSRP